MHYSVIQFFCKAFSLQDFKEKRIIEVGSANINGSLRDIIVPIMNPSEYIGTDIQMGNYVDRVISAAELLDNYGPNSFDVIICTEMLEHALDWKTAIYNMKAILKESGQLFLSTRSEGFPLHNYPDDYWRFSEEDMWKVFVDFKGRLYIDIDRQDPGVFVAGIKPMGWINKDLTDVEVYSMEKEKI